MTNRCGRLAVGIAALCSLAVPVGAQTTAAPQPPPFVADPGDLDGPRQPIFFRHDVHAGQYRIPCLYCHATVTVSSEPGIPAMETCMGCHRLVAGGTRPGLRDSTERNAERAEVQKLRDLRRDRQVPEWVRIHTLPQFVRFPHMRHVKALGEGTPGGGAMTCTLCHGDVQNMAQVYQVETLKMGWCVRCHVERRVSRDCTVCHY
ncbi:MAG TPA: cytochrome c3 family protein [Gemmatimonadales bacterium]|nr:cytochrome c3 family protein [Gemmatimonadales bacterium]